MAYASEIYVICMLYVCGMHVICMWYACGVYVACIVIYAYDMLVICNNIQTMVLFFFYTILQLTTLVPSCLHIFLYASFISLICCPHSSLRSSVFLEDLSSFKTK